MSFSFLAIISYLQLVLYIYVEISPIYYNFQKVERAEEFRE